MSHKISEVAVPIIHNRNNFYGDVMAFFPLFIDLEERPCLLIGGGRIALRRAKVLLDFGAKLFVISPEICPELKALCNGSFSERPYKEGDCAGMALVAAASGNPETDKAAGEECKKLGILFNAASSREESAFFFSSYLKQGQAVAAFSGGGNPVMGQKLKDNYREFMTPLTGEISELLCSLREDKRIKAMAEEKRKKLFSEIYELCIERGCIPSEEELTEEIENAV